MKKRVIKERVKYCITIMLAFVLFFINMGLRVEATQSIPPFQTEASIATDASIKVVTENNMEHEVLEKDDNGIEEIPQIHEMNIRHIPTNNDVETTPEEAVTTASAILLAESYDSKEEMPTCKLATLTPKPVQEPPSTSYTAPQHSGFKSWLPHRRQNGDNMFASWSTQYKLQLKANTSPNGLRKYKDRYLIALGSYYTETIGTYVDLIMEDGTVIKCILGDQKADKDTDTFNQVHNDGSLVEFLVDRTRIPHIVKQRGDVSFVDESFNQKVAYIKVYDKIAKY